MHSDIFVFCPNFTLSLATIEERSSVSSHFKKHPATPRSFCSTAKLLPSFKGITGNAVMLRAIGCSHYNCSQRQCIMGWLHSLRVGLFVRRSNYCKLISEYYRFHPRQQGQSLRLPVWRMAPWPIKQIEKFPHPVRDEKRCLQEERIRPF